MNGGERTSLDSLEAVAPPADLGKVAECGGGHAEASVPDGRGDSPNTPGRGGFLLLRAREGSTRPAGTMVTGNSES